MADPRGNRPKLTQRNATAVRRYKLYEADYYTLGYDGQLFGTQHVVEYEEETPSELPPGQTLSQPPCRCSRSWMRNSSTRSMLGWKPSQNGPS